MKPGRNDPCPCGSGRKYKSCCQQRDEEASATGMAGLTREQRETVRSAAAWEVDAIPLRVSIGNDEGSRPVVVLVTAADLVVGSKMPRRLSGEPEAIAAVLEDAVVSCARLLGAFPERVHVRFAELVEPLATRLRERAVTVAYAEEMPALKEAAVDLMEHTQGSGEWPPIAIAHRWSGWDLPRSLVRELFAAAASFWRAGPWQYVQNEQAPLLTLPSGRNWTASILGAGEEIYGVSLYSDADDLVAQMNAPHPEAAFSMVRGRLLTLTFDDASEVPRGTIAEARMSDWEMASPRAFPTLVTINTPAGGVSARDAYDLIAALRALPVFAELHAATLADELADGPPDITWRDAATGVEVRYAGAAVALDDDETSAFDPGFDFGDVLREVAERLGPEAGPDALMAAMNQELAHRTRLSNAAPQADLGGLSPDQVHRLMAADWSTSEVIAIDSGLTLVELEPSTLLHDARLLLLLAQERDGLRATEKGNLGVDVVREMLRGMRQDPELLAVFRDDKRVIEQDLTPLHRLRMLLVLARLLARRKGRFQLTAAGRKMLREDRAGELQKLLFTTSFRKMNLSYAYRARWPELQSQMAYTLYRLRDVATGWVKSDEVVRKAVLPHALEHAPQSHWLDEPALLFSMLALDLLEEFGLIEARRGPLRSALRSETTYRKSPLYDRFLRFAV